MPEEIGSGVLKEITKLQVIDVTTEKVLVEITSEEIIATSTVIVKLTPTYD